MKATFEFDLNEPDERLDHYRHTKSEDMALCLFSIQQHLRNADKYEWNVERLTTEIRNELEEYGINIDELVK